MEKLEHSDLEFAPFLEEVDKKLYTDYLMIIPLEMNLAKIKSRILLLYYRHRAALVSDIKQIRVNCIKYNQEEAIISQWADKLEQKLLQVVEGSLDVSNLKRVEKPEREPPSRTRTQKSRLLIEEEDEEENEPSEKKEE